LKNRLVNYWATTDYQRRSRSQKILAFAMRLWSPSLMRNKGYLMMGAGVALAGIILHGQSVQKVTVDKISTPVIQSSLTRDPAPPAPAPQGLLARDPAAPAPAPQGLLAGDPPSDPAPKGLLAADPIQPADPPPKGLLANNSTTSTALDLKR
jgi:hypothetical protein